MADTENDQMLRSLSIGDAFAIFALLLFALAWAAGWLFGFDLDVAQLEEMDGWTFLILVVLLAVPILGVGVAIMCIITKRPPSELLP